MRLVEPKDSVNEWGRRVNSAEFEVPCFYEESVSCHQQYDTLCRIMIGHSSIHENTCLCSKRSLDNETISLETHSFIGVVEDCRREPQLLATMDANRKRKVQRVTLRSFAFRSTPSSWCETRNSFIRLETV